jgi:hypothetical protein
VAARIKEDHSNSARRPLWRARLPSERDVARFSRRLAFDGGQQVAVRVADTVVTGR